MKIRMKRKNKIVFIVLSFILVLLIVVVGVNYYMNKVEEKEDLIREGNEGKVERIEGAMDLDESYVDKMSGEIKVDEMRGYIRSEIEITKRAIENYKDNPEQLKRYQNRLNRLNEILEKMK